MLVVFLIVAATSSWAVKGKQTSGHETTKPEEPLSHSVPQLDEGIHLNDFADMAPRPEIRQKLLHISGFVQNTPNDGKPATEDTEVWMGYTKTSLYIAFVCHDSHPEQMRGHLARRENILKDDRITVLLDTFKDRRTGVQFSVNPAGVEADAAWSETTGSDYNYDQVWDSEARVTPTGWIALIGIPFRSLRFRVSGGDWGVVFWRNLPRNSETDYWPRVSASVSGVLSQEATLRGIAGVTGSHNVQINPYTLGQNERALNTLDPLNPFFSARRAEGTAGGEFKAILKDKIVFDATVNPDFSDVESDQPQFTVNQRYPVYFPELRPFFLENASYFQTPITLVYTRNIVHPEFGARTTGKLGRVNIGMFAIDDREPGETVAADDSLYSKRAKIAVGRASIDLGKGSNIGAIYTDQEFGGGWNRIGGVDFNARVNDHWTALGQWVESATRGNVDSGTTPTYAAGPASYFELIRNGHAFNLDSVFQDVSTNFETDLGFIQASNLRNSQTHATYKWFPKHSAIQSWGLETNQNFAFDHQGNRVYRYMTFDPFWLLPRNMVLAPIFGENSDTLGPQNGYSLTANRNFSENFAGFVARGSPWPQLYYNLQFTRSGNVNYNPLSGKTPFLMNEETVQALTTVQPVRQLTFDNTYLLDRNHAVSNGAFVYESQTMRTKVNYQFTRALSARVIVEYDSTLANANETSLKRTKLVGTQALLTWLPHPGTAIYVGYNNDMQNLDRALCNRLATGRCDANNTVAPRSPTMMDDGKQIFIKASYLLRF
jgi:hypothetical protein